jgi:kynurenine formamidase
VVIGTQHTGAHIDAHAHMTVGNSDRWHGGSALTDLGDFGPLRGDASEIPPLWRRGVLYDVPGFRQIDALPAGEPVTADELRAIEQANGVSVASGDVALVRTGYLAGWPDPEQLSRHRGAGPEISTARMLAERGVVAVGSDTETFEVQPAPDRGDPSNPQPVHTLLLIEKGIYGVSSSRTGRRRLL